MMNFCSLIDLFSLVNMDIKIVDGVVVGAKGLTPRAFVDAIYVDGVGPGQNLKYSAKEAFFSIGAATPI